MAGHLRVIDIPEPWRQTVQSAMQFPVYQSACRVLRLVTKQERREALDKLPVGIRGTVEAEVLRIWKVRAAK